LPTAKPYGALFLPVCVKLSDRENTAVWSDGPTPSINHNSKLRESYQEKNAKEA